MSLFHALILGLVQGITEFVPISSSAHLVLVPWLFGWTTADTAFALAFDTILHLGTLAAVVGFFWRDLVNLAAGWLDTVRRRSLDNAQGRLAWILILATIPAAVMGLAFNDLFESLFGSPVATAVLLLATGLFLVASERWGGSDDAIDTLKAGPALVIGVAQGLAIAPGISRSGATISAGRFLGLDRTAAARFAFLLAIPTIAGAGLVQLRRLSGTGEIISNAAPLLVGFMAALVSGYLVIRLLLNYLKQHSVLPFAIYCWVLGAACLAIWVAR